MRNTTMFLATALCVLASVSTYAETERCGVSIEAAPGAVPVELSMIEVAVAEQRSAQTPQRFDRAGCRSMLSGASAITYDGCGNDPKDCQAQGERRLGVLLSGSVQLTGPTLLIECSVALDGPADLQARVVETTAPEAANADVSTVTASVTVHDCAPEQPEGDAE